MKKSKETIGTTGIINFQIKPKEQLTTTNTKKEALNTLGEGYEVKETIKIGTETYFIIHKTKLYGATKIGIIKKGDENKAAENCMFYDVSSLKKLDSGIYYIGVNFEKKWGLVKYGEENIVKINLELPIYIKWDLFKPSELVNAIQRVKYDLNELLDNIKEDEKGIYYPGNTFYGQNKYI